ncbi:DUF1642 domain-containing protein [Bacillus sp. BB56-3]|uniref:DUF1642 domain-containing protein n=1 Tax=Bacillus sp. BB56-3 TaxID=2217831 RepID=UPI0011EDC472|nr:DUF1642 domain-containing protein [Bacillus sp. BB56-3]KAA0784323.1 hypothetical protein DN406_27305 [Bacillus sp. BB56-3]
MKKFEFKQEVKCTCGCNRILGIVLAGIKESGMWAIAREEGVAFMHEKNMDVVKEPAVKIPKEIADILGLKQYSSAPNAMWEILNKQAHELFKTSWLFEKGNLIKLARAIEYGYEVEAPVIRKNDYVVFENKDVKWIAKCSGVEGNEIEYAYAIEFKLGKYDHDDGGKVTMDLFDVRVATEDEEKALRRAAAFIKNNRKFNQFMPFDIAVDKSGYVVRVEKETDKDGNVVVFYGNEEDGYLSASRPAAELTLRYLAEDRVDL